ncbi:MAG: hypothetical protein JXJ22_04580 [Bacteroidales bacterium]|nr:hypothetical protein [Bacteroidales bacterium]
MNKNFYKYYILKDKNLYIEILKGNFDLADFINLKKTESEDPDFDPNFNSILDIRNIENTFSKDIKNDLEKFSKIIKTLQSVTKRRKAAIITCKPSQVAGSTWYQLIDDRGIDYKVFSTLEAATEWLGINEIDLKNIDFSLTDS